MVAVQISSNWALASSVLCCFGFVASLYVWRNPLPRDNPIQIKRRFASIICWSLISCGIVWIWTVDDSKISAAEGKPFNVWIGFSGEYLWTGIIYPLLLTMSLFLGPMVNSILEWIQSENHNVASEQNYWIIARNYLVAPACEEFVFRTCVSCLLLCGGVFRICFTY